MGSEVKEPRKLSREVRRAQLIEATIRTLAARGYARTTLTEVAKVAGLSHGLVLFHFGSKEQLLEETLQYLSDEYRASWTSALKGAPHTPAARLDALVRADFSTRMVSQDRLSAWCAFWGEAQSRPLYQQKCAASDAEYAQTVEAICADLIQEGGYRHDPALVSQALRAMIEGLSLELMTASGASSAKIALRAVYGALSAYFPKHFRADGLAGIIEL